MKTFKRSIPDICFLEPGSSAPLAKHIAWREIPVFAASLCYLLNLPSIMHSVIDNEIIPHSDEKKIQTIAELKLVFIFAPSLGSIAQLVQSTCLTSRGSQVRTLLLPQRKVTFGGFFYFYPLLSGLSKRNLDTKTPSHKPVCLTQSGRNCSKSDK